MNRYDNFVGKILDERYKINSIVGIGGMAVVFKAEDLIMNRVVAIKVLKTDSADADKSIRRFLNESKAVAMLSHPNIVSIYDINVKDDIKYIVMEYVEGTSLKEYLSRAGRLNWKEALKYADQILKGLSHAHEKGLVHRDIKPQNILLLKDGTIKIADFGIAKLPHTETLTNDNTALGTVHYISPEQANGKEVTLSSDIYSVGIMLYEMVTGKLPFDADSPVSVALMHITDDPVAPKEILPMLPDGLQFIILKAIAKKPDMRFADCDEMHKYIAELIKNPEVVFMNTVPVAKHGVARHAAGNDENKSSGTPNGGKHNKKSGEITAKKKRNTMMPVVFGVFLSFLIVLVVSGIIVLKTVWDLTYGVATGDDERGDYVFVEDLVGKTYDEEFANYLSKKGYKVTTIEGYSTQYGENVIIAQNIKEGTRKRQGFSIKLTISKGANSYALDNYALTEYREVTREMVTLGLVPKVVQVNNDFVANGYVVKTEPAAGSTVSPGDTVRIYVSMGSKPEFGNIPEVVLYPIDTAVAMLEDAGFTLGELIYCYSEFPEGTVISQSEIGGANAVKHFTKVDLGISIGPEPSDEDHHDPFAPSGTDEEDADADEDTDQEGDLTWN